MMELERYLSLQAMTCGPVYREITILISSVQDGDGENMG